MLKNFEELLDNIFRPLFEVTIDPQTHPELHQFLKQVCRFEFQPKLIQQPFITLREKGGSSLL